MQKGVILITGSNGEIGRSLIERIAEEGRYSVVSLDLTPIPESVRPLCAASYAGNIMDRYLLDQIAAHHEIDAR
jgi:nucleoside-diphosphate-sugar epimerase